MKKEGQQLIRKSNFVANQIWLCYYLFWSIRFISACFENEKTKNPNQNSVFKVCVASRNCWDLTIISTHEKRSLI